MYGVKSVLTSLTCASMYTLNSRVKTGASNATDGPLPPNTLAMHMYVLTILYYSGERRV